MFSISHKGTASSTIQYRINNTNHLPPRKLHLDTLRWLLMSCHARVYVCVYVGTRWGGHSQGPQCWVAQRSAECTRGRIAEIKECDKDRRKRRKMTGRGYRSGNDNKKRERLVWAVLFYPQWKAVNYASQALREGEEEGREVRLSYKWADNSWPPWFTPSHIFFPKSSAKMLQCGIRKCRHPQPPLTALLLLGDFTHTTAGSQSHPSPKSC